MESNEKKIIEIPLDGEELAFIINQAQKAGYNSDYVEFFKDAVNKVYSATQGARQQVPPQANQNTAPQNPMLAGASSGSSTSSIPWTAITIGFIGLSIIIIMVMLLFGGKKSKSKKKNQKADPVKATAPATTDQVTATSEHVQNKAAIHPDSPPLSNSSVQQPVQQTVEETVTTQPAQVASSPQKVNANNGDSEVEYEDVQTDLEESELQQENDVIIDEDTAKSVEKGKKSKNKKNKRKKQKQKILNFR